MLPSKPEASVSFWCLTNFPTRPSATRPFLPSFRWPSTRCSKRRPPSLFCAVAIRASWRARCSGEKARFSGVARRRSSLAILGFGTPLKCFRGCLRKKPSDSMDASVAFRIICSRSIPQKACVRISHSCILIRWVFFSRSPMACFARNSRNRLCTIPFCAP